MAIFQLFDHEKKEDSFTETFDQGDSREDTPSKSRLFSTLITRFCFFLLLLADGAWFLYNILLLTLSFLGFCLTLGKSTFFKRWTQKFWLQFRRSLICGLSLSIGLFSPPFGIMVACSYFLMYDKAGMEEVVPAPLQAQFKDIFKTEK